MDASFSAICRSFQQFVVSEEESKGGAVSGNIGNQEGRMGEGQKGPHCGLRLARRWTELVIGREIKCQHLSSPETSVILSQLLICCSLPPCPPLT